MGITHRIARPREEEGGRGHSKVLHPADLRIEAWGPTREDASLRRYAAWWTVSPWPRVSRRMPGPSGT